MENFLGESGRVHYWAYDKTGILPGDLFSVLSSIVFGLKHDIRFPTTREERQEVSWWDQDLMDYIEIHANNQTYTPYAQKRFAKHGGVPNPMVSKDAFTQWLLSAKENRNTAG